MSDEDIHFGYEHLTANQIDANPSVLRHPGAPVRTKNRSGQKGGVSKDHFDETFIRRKYDMLASPAYAALSLSAHRVMSRLEIEFGKHAGKREHNGSLICTFDDFSEYGVSRNEISPAIRELVALGFIRVTRKGSAGNEQHRQPTLYLLTYQFHGSHAMLEDGWKRIQTLEEAQAIAKRARAAKPDARAAANGRRGGKAKAAKNKSPVMESIPSPSHGIQTDHPNFPVMESIPLSRVSRGGPGSGLGAVTGRTTAKPPDRAVQANEDAA